MNRKRKGSVVFSQGKDGRGKLDFQVWGAVSWRGLWRHSSKQFLFLRGIKEGTCGRREWEQRRKRERGGLDVWKRWLPRSGSGSVLGSWQGCLKAHRPGHEEPVDTLLAFD